jgi:protein SCO1/2
LREELETGDSAVTVAAAAVALQHLKPRPDWAAKGLVNAAIRFAHTDDHVIFAPRVTDSGTKTTVLSALKDAAAKTSCGCAPPILAAPDTQPRMAPTDITFEDQTGAMRGFGDLFDHNLTIVAFFYTRCMNPAKCAATIAQMAVLAKSQTKAGCIAITYDPTFDTSARLRAYAQAQNVDALRLVRPLEGIAPFIKALDLQVGFGETTVNRHRSEVFIIGADACVKDSFLRRPFTAQSALAALETLS